MFLFGLDNGTSSTHLQTSSSCYYVNSCSMKLKYNKLYVYCIMDNSGFKLKCIGNVQLIEDQKYRSSVHTKEVIQVKDKKQRKLIVVYGIPASGKSSFSLFLSQLFSDCLLVSADKIQLQVWENRNLIEVIRAQNEQQTIKWMKILNSKYQKEKRVQFNKQIWKQSRKCCESIVEKLSNYTSIILEDDLLLRSQRKVYKKISWVNKLLYLEILMDSTLQQCLQNLHLRNKGLDKLIITEQIVKKQALKLQKQEISYGINIKLQDRFQISKKDLQSRMKVVEIKPNDPNDPFFSVQKEKYVHTSAELHQIQIRNFIHETMKLSFQQLLSKYGNIAKPLENKKKLAALLSEWKKKQARKVSEKVLLNTNFQERLKQYLQQIQK